jgi:hypothetical protein
MSLNEVQHASSYYMGVVIYESSSDAPNYEPLYEESFFLIQAESEEQARQKAVLYAQNAKTRYQNEQGETITWSVKTIVDVSAVLANTIEDGSELYARHFRDYQVYESFEPLLSGKSL